MDANPGENRRKSPRKRSARIARELTSTVNERKGLLKSVYEAFIQAHYRPSEALLLPDVDLLRAWYGFVKLIDADIETVITAEDFDAPFKTLKKRLGQHQVTRKTKLTEPEQFPFGRVKGTDAAYLATAVYSVLVSPAGVSSLAGCNMDRILVPLGATFC